MPIYEQQCPVCYSKIEYLTGISDPRATSLRKCSCGATMEFLYSVPAVQIFREYTTNHILPHGKPITITSSRQEASVLRENGLCKADSNPTK
jgi:hypothetical protein